ncbi:mechanosensitive ion channel family protein [Nocardiopsis coralliicola]
MDIGQGLTTAWAAVASFVPRLAAFLVILIIGWFVALWLGRLVGKGLARLGLDRGLDRSGVGEYFQRSRWSASELCGKIIYYAGVLITLQLAFSVFGPTNPITQLLNEVVAWIPQAVVALVIVVVAGILAKAAKDVISGAMGGLSYGRFVANVAGVAILALGIIAALNQIGVATTVTQPVLIATLATVGGVIVVGVGGGLIRPMQERWGRWLDSAERETSRVQGSGQDGAGYAAGRQDAMSGTGAQSGSGQQAEREEARQGTGAGPGMQSPEHGGEHRRPQSP